MPEYSIYALKVVEEWGDVVYKSLKSGEGRFGWSYVETVDLKLLQITGSGFGFLDLAGYL